MLLRLSAPSGRVEHVTPKITRFLTYIDICACTLFWPLARMHIMGGGSGPCNSLCDYICRLVGQLKRLKNAMVNEDPCEYDEVPYEFEETDPCDHAEHVLVMSVSGDDDQLTHETSGFDYGTDYTSVLFQDDATPQDVLPNLAAYEAELIQNTNSVPKGYTFDTFTLTDAEWAEVHRAYADDKTSWCSIRLCDIHAVFNDNFHGSQLVTDQVKAWTNTVFFPITMGGKKIVCTLGSAQREIESDVDRTRVIVIVVPNDAAVHVTTNPISDDDADAVQEWAKRDFRADILWWAHNAKIPHAKLIETQDRATSVAWFPSIERRAAYFYRTCGVCHDQISTVDVIGCGVASLVAYAVVQIDRWLLPKWMTKLASVTYDSVMSFTCICTGETVFALMSSSDGSETALTFFIHWFKRNGAPVVLWSDNAPEYISKMMEVFCKLIGVKKQIYSALGKHCRFVERKQAVLAKVMYQAEKLGQGVNDSQLALYVAHAEMETNLLSVVDGSTVFERTKGLKPRTSRNILVEPHGTLTVADMTADEIIESLNCPSDIATANAIHDRCCELLGSHRIAQAVRSRRNMCNRLKTGVKGVDWSTMNEGLVLGDLVSFRGMSWRMLDAEGPSDEVFTKVLIRHEDGREKDEWVSFNLVRPLCVEREQLRYPTGDLTKYEPGDIIAYNHSSGTQLGLVIDNSASDLYVQQYEPRKGVYTTWVLL